MTGRNAHRLRSSWEGTFPSVPCGGCGASVSELDAHSYNGRYRCSSCWERRDQGEAQCLLCGPRLLRAFYVRADGSHSPYCRSCLRRMPVEQKALDPLLIKEREANVSRVQENGRRFRSKPGYQDIRSLYQQRYAERHPEAAKRNRRRQNFRRRGGALTAAAERFLPVLLQDPCAYCGAPSEEIDHITAVAAGGTGCWTNLTGACRSCNGGKSDRPLLIYLLVRGGGGGHR